MPYPTTLDTTATLPNPSAGNNTNNPSHAGLHSAENAAIIAAETKLGTGASVPAANTLLIGTGPGTSAWSQLTSAQLAAVLSDETGNGAAVFANTPVLITPKVDTIQENTLNNGVTVAGVNLKGGVITGSGAGLTAVPGPSLAPNSVDASRIKWGAIGAGAGIWWEELGRNTLSAIADTISVTIPARKFLRVMVGIKSSGATDVNLRFNGDTAANYAYQYQLLNNTTNTVSTALNQNGLGLHPANLGNNDDGFGTYDIYNPSGRQKLVSGSFQLVGGAASNYDPVLHVYGHWINTASQITTVSVTNVQSGDYAIGSDLIILGHD